MSNNETSRFAVGATYFTRSIGDYNCIYRFEILRRTASSVWINVDGEVKRRKISTYGGSEIFQPFGSYSMAPTISADRPVN